MKTVKIFTILILIGNFSLADSVWEKSFESGINKIKCMELIAHRSIGYIGTSAGLFKTGDNGKSWKKIELPVGIIEVKDIVFSADRVYILTQKGFYEKKSGWNNGGRFISRKSGSESFIERLRKKHDKD